MDSSRNRLDLVFLFCEQERGESECAMASYAAAHSQCLRRAGSCCVQYGVRQQVRHTSSGFASIPPTICKSFFLLPSLIRLQQTSIIAFCPAHCFPAYFRLCFCCFDFQFAAFIGPHAWLSSFHIHAPCKQHPSLILTLKIQVQEHRGRKSKLSSVFTAPLEFAKNKMDEVDPLFAFLCPPFI